MQLQRRRIKALRQLDFLHITSHTSVLYRAKTGVENFDQLTRKIPETIARRRWLGWLVPAPRRTLRIARMRH